MNSKTYTFDAKGKMVGRLASDIALVLQGKNAADFLRHQDTGPKVKVINASKMKVSGNKMVQKKYYSHSGHPQGLKVKPLREVWQKDVTLVLRKTVKGMMPKNKLLNDRMKKLTIEK
jgi:large subunit ribosomal protein L13